MWGKQNNHFRLCGLHDEVSLHTVTEAVINIPLCSAQINVNHDLINKTVNCLSILGPHTSCISCLHLATFDVAHLASVHQL